MVGRPLASLALLLVVALAGCSGQPKASDKPSIAELANEAQKVDVAATATTGVIRGIVVDEAVRPVAGVNVTLTAGNKTTKSNEKGAFGFEDLDPGTYFFKVHKHGYADIQASADVVAGVANPTAVRVQILSVKLPTPAAEVQQFRMHLSASGWASTPVGGTGVTCCFVAELGNDTSWFFNFNLEGNGTQFVQVLTAWQAQTPAAENALVEASMLDNDKAFAGNSTTGATPSIMEFHAADFQNHTGQLAVSGDIYAYSGTVPVGLSAQQDYTIIVVATYNFAPPAGYRFDVDGAPVVPSSA